MKRTLLKRNPPDRATVAVVRARKCKACKALFTPARPLQVACGLACAMELGARARAAAERKADQARREKLRTTKEWRAEAQKAFNAFIRQRDAGRPCICCGQPMEPDKPGGAVDAGHYLSVGSAPNLRFDERNVHAQRKNCNRPGGTTRAAFRAGMIDRIGLAAVEALEADQAPRHYSADDLREIRDTYRRRARELRKGTP